MRPPVAYKGLWVVVTLFLLFVPPLLVYKMKNAKNTQNSSHTKASPVASKSVPQPIIKSIGENTIEYRLYGRVMQVGKESPSGIPFMFVLDADPVQTVMAGFIRPQEKKYELLRYDSNFNKRLDGEWISGTELVLQALASSRSLELALTLPKNGRSTEEESLIGDLDSIIGGNWKSMPTQRLMIHSIGVKARM